MKKFLAAGLALIVCFAVLFTGCRGSEFTGNYNTELTAEALEEKVSGLSLDDIDQAEQSEVSGYRMTFNTDMKVIAKVDDKTNETKMRCNGDVRYTFGETGLSMFSKVQMNMKDTEGKTEICYVDGVLYSKTSGKTNGVPFDEKVKAEMPELDYGISDTEATAIDIDELIEAVRAGGAKAYVEASDANKIKIVLDAKELLKEISGNLGSIMAGAELEASECVAEAYIRLNDSGALVGYKMSVKLKAGVTVADMGSVSLDVKLNTILTEFNGKINAPSDADSYVYGD
ncbi:MAG: hypothetical protein DBX59_05610 [Bacillota bacterium]|nr:MAG: hypothetical protein DBX59_05610 [Bacillota bacterium]